MAAPFGRMPSAESTDSLSTHSFAFVRASPALSNGQSPNAEPLEPLEPPLHQEKQEEQQVLLRTIARLMHQVQEELFVITSKTTKIRVGMILALQYII